jgi:hypothetical protein
MRYSTSDKTGSSGWSSNRLWRLDARWRNSAFPDRLSTAGMIAIGAADQTLADRPSRPDRVWNRIPEAIRSQIVDLVLDQPELSPRELAVRFTDEAKYFVSEASVYRLLKAHDLITSPAYIVTKAGEEFKDKTTAAARPSSRSATARRQRAERSRFAGQFSRSETPLKRSRNSSTRTAHTRTCRRRSRTSSAALSPTRAEAVSFSGRSTGSATRRSTARSSLR